MLASRVSFGVRPARLADALGIEAVRHAAVHQLAAGYYPASLRELWAPDVTLSGAERRYREAQDEGGLCFVAESAGGVVGYGIVIPEAGEIAGCYVLPTLVRQGIGRRLLETLEIAATSIGAFELALRTPVNAKPFFSARGYLVTGRGELRFIDGTAMAVVHMHKDLAPVI